MSDEHENTPFWILFRELLENQRTMMQTINTLATKEELTKLQSQLLEIQRAKLPSWLTSAIVTSVFGFLSVLGANLILHALSAVHIGP